MKNTIKQILPKLILLVILLNFSNKSFSQANCCDNDTFYFDNQVDCPICITFECFDPNTGMATQFLIDTIINNTPLMSLPSKCPNPNCLPYSRGYISCGGPAGHQLGKIVLFPNSCELCPNIRIGLSQVGGVSPFPPVYLYTLAGPYLTTFNNCPCCPSSAAPNLEFSLDCTTKTLSLKCVQ